MDNRKDGRRRCRGNRATSPRISSNGVQIVNGEPSLLLGVSSVQALLEMLNKLKAVACSREVVLADPKGIRQHTLSPTETALLMELDDVDKSCRTGAAGYHRSMRVDLAAAATLLGSMDLLEEYAGALPRHYLDQRKILGNWLERAHAVELNLKNGSPDAQN